MIIDLIALGVTFAAGLWCGKTFGGFGATWQAVKAKAKALFKDDTPKA
jgi:hypothetical protein